MKPVFVHISKNAGTSITNTAGASIRVAGHRTAENWITENGQSAPLFAVVRNPFDRVVSEYFYRRKRFVGGEENPHLSNLGKPFDEWVISTYHDGEYRSRRFLEAHGIPYNRFNMIDDCLIWFLPQTLWVADKDGEILVDDILRYETLADDWNRFSKKFGISRVLAQHNVSKRSRDYRCYYSPRTREIVQAYFRADLEAFDYTFD